MLVWNLGAIREDGEVLDAEVYPHRLVACGQAWDGFSHEDGHEPSARRVEGHGHRAGAGLAWQGAAPHDMERLAHLRQSQALPVPPEGGAHERCASAVLLGMELGVPGPLVVEVDEPCLEVAQRLLKGDRGHFFEERQLRVFLPTGEQLARVEIGDPPMLLRPRFRAIVERLVAHEPRAADGALEQPLLLRCRIEAEPVRPLLLADAHI